MKLASEYDAVVVGSGPNGLGAAIELARQGRSVLVLEAHARPGGGMRTEELTLPGFKHDVCSAIHPTAVLSPLFRSLALERYGLRWCSTDVAVAHPLPGGRAAVLFRSLDETADALGSDGKAWRRLVGPLLKGAPLELFADLLAPLRIPRHPIQLARFGMRALRSATGLAKGWFRNEEARALFAGCAAHSILDLSMPASAALGVVFGLSAHVEAWPCVQGGSENLARALVAHLEALGGEIRCNVRVESLRQLPPSKAVFFDTSPHGMLEIAGEALPASYKRRLERFRYGPGLFKVDWALDGPIPWANAVCYRASTLHVAGDLESVAAAERAAWRGEDIERPHVLVCQQSALDPSRAPAGKHTGYAYCHVPHGSPTDYTERIERQIEQFAPGFRDLILARHVMSPSWLERYNPNQRGGVVTGGAADITQLFTRPVARLSPYTTPNPRLFLCSASTPPGGGVHGMCGFWAARSALRRVLR